MNIEASFNPNISSANDKLYSLKLSRIAAAAAISLSLVISRDSQIETQQSSVKDEGGIVDTQLIGSSEHLSGSVTLPDGTMVEAPKIFNCPAEHCVDPNTTAEVVAGPANVPEIFSCSCHSTVPVTANY